MRHYLCDKPVPVGFLRVQVLAAKHYIPRPRETHQLDQARASAVARDKADHALPKHEAGIFRGDAQVDTALNIAASTALTQTDIKRVIAYATMAQRDDTIMVVSAGANA